VAIIDSGITDVGEIPLYRDYMGEWDHYYNDWYPIDFDGHGTRVALAFLSIANAIPESNPRITALRVQDETGDFPVTAIFYALLDAGGRLNNFARWASGGPLTLTGEYKIDVINMSFGSEIYSELEHIGMNEVYFNSDALMVAGAGNSGSAPGYPAELAYFFGGRVIAVGASDPAGNMHDYSARAGERNKDFFIVAHSEAEGPFSGTSYAAPRVSGLASVIKDRWPHLSGLEVGNIILSTATDLGEPGPDPVYGRGLMNIVAALNPVGQPSLSDGFQRYSLSDTRAIISNAWGEIARKGRYVSYFDDYNRDFRMAITHSRSPVSSILQREMGWSEFGRKHHVRSRVEIANGSLTTSLARVDYQPSASAQQFMQEISWQLDVAHVAGRSYVGYGNTANWFYKPQVLDLSFSPEDPTTSGHNPVLQLAATGAHIGNRMDYGDNFSVMVGVACNSEVLGISETTSDATASAVSFTGSSPKKQWTGNITAVYLMEENGLLGSRLSGAFGQAHTFDTAALTFSGDWRLGAGFVLSGSYTLAQSRTDDENQHLLAIGDRLGSDAFAFGLSKNRIFDQKDSLYFSVSQPLRIAKGTARLSHDDYYRADGSLQRRTVHIDLEPSGREIDLQLGYTRRLSGDTRFELMLFHAEDTSHVAGQEDSGGMARLEWAF